MDKTLPEKVAKLRKFRTDPCMVAKCGRYQNARGLCISHYVIAQGLVKNQKTTWEALETAGKAKQPRGLASDARRSYEDYLLGKRDTP